MGSSVGSRVKTGKYICAAATDMVIELEFTPSYIRLVNATTLYTVEFYEGMAAASGFETTNAGAKTLETSSLITTHLKFNMDDTSPTVRGFTLGQRANVNDTADEIIYWEAVE